MNHRYDTDRIKAALEARLPPLLADLYGTEVVREGNVWRIGSVHGGRGRSTAIFRSASGSVRWYDHAQEGGGDVIDLVRHARGFSGFSETLAWATAWLGATPVPPGSETPGETQPSTAKRTWFPAVPPPRSVPDFARAVPWLLRGQAKRWSRLSFTRAWPYRAATGDLIAFAARYDGIDGDVLAAKIVLPWTYRRNAITGERGWRIQAMAPPRSLYNLDRIAARPNSMIIVCEGEKAADAAGRLLPGIGTTSPGGAKAAHSADWSPLANHTVLIAPDHDPAGQRYAACVAIAAVATGAAFIRLLNWPEHLVPTGTILVRRETLLPTGHDLADAVAEGWTMKHLSTLRDHGWPLFPRVGVLP